MPPTNSIHTSLAIVLFVVHILQYCRATSTKYRCFGKHAFKLSQMLGTKWTMNIESTERIVWIDWVHRDTWRVSYWQFGAHGPQTVKCLINWCVKYDSVCGARTQNANHTNDRQLLVDNYKQDESVWIAKSKESSLLISVHVSFATLLTDSIKSNATQHCSKTIWICAIVC